MLPASHVEIFIGGFMDLHDFWKDLVSMILWSGFFRNLLVFICCISIIFIADFIVIFFGLTPLCAPGPLDAWC